MRPWKRLRDWHMLSARPLDSSNLALRCVQTEDETLPASPMRASHTHHQVVGARSANSQWAVLGGGKICRSLNSKSADRTRTVKLESASPCATMPLVTSVELTGAIVKPFARGKH